MTSLSAHEWNLVAGNSNHLKIFLIFMIDKMASAEKLLLILYECHEKKRRRELQKQNGWRRSAMHKFDFTTLCNATKKSKLYSTQVTTFTPCYSSFSSFPASTRENFFSYVSAVIFKSELIAVMYIALIAVMYISLSMLHSSTLVTIWRSYAALKTFQAAKYELLKLFLPTETLKPKINGSVRDRKKYNQSYHCCGVEESLFLDA